MRIDRSRWAAALVLLACFTAGGARAATRTLSGQVAGDRFGGSVAYAGDVNGDGYDDFLVGIPGRNLAGEDAGEVDLYLGRFGVFPEVPDLILPGELAGDAFGAAVSSAGDINRDGYDDFLVGAPGSDTENLDSGRVYLFFGGATPDGVADASWGGDFPAAHFGAAVAGGFDFNGDHRPDFVVGAPNHNGAGLRAGRVTVFLGASGSIAEAAYTFDGDFPNWALGHSVDGAGDMNGDGFDEIIAGAPQPFDANSGRAIIWFGSSSTLGQPKRVVLTGEVGTDRFGWDVTGVGDLDGDSRDDVLVGAPKQGFDNGAIYLYRGGAIVGPGFDWKATGAVGGDLLGTAVDGGFDINGDGTPDMVAGAPGTDDPKDTIGEIHVYYGSASPSVAGDRIEGPVAPNPDFSAGDAFGTTVRFIGSYNGDANAELLAGAPDGNAADGTEAGYVNFLTHADSFTPVRLLAFTAVAEDGAVELRWDLAETDALAGLRLEADRGSGYRPLHEGWLDAVQREYRDGESSLAGARRYRLTALDRGGSTLLLGETRVSTGTLRASLARNPFRGRAAIQVGAPAGFLRVDLWDVRGRRVARLWNGASSGALDLEWNGRDDLGRRAAPGIYFLRVVGAGETLHLRLVRLP